METGAGEVNVSLSLTILPESEEEAVRAMESLSRVAMGVAFEGISLSINIVSYDPGEEERELP